MLGPHATKPDIVVTIVGIVVVAIGRAQVVGIVVVPRPAANDPFAISLPSAAGKLFPTTNHFLTLPYLREPHGQSMIESIG